MSPIGGAAASGSSRALCTFMGGGAKLREPGMVRGVELSGLGVAPPVFGVTSKTGNRSEPFAASKSSEPVSVGFCDVVSAPVNSASPVVDSMSPIVRWMAGSRRHAGSAAGAAGAAGAADSPASIACARPKGHHFGISEVSQLVSRCQALNQRYVALPVSVFEVEQVVL
jgi:hypothetical protein